MPRSRLASEEASLRRAERLVLDLLAIPGRSGEEEAVAEYVRRTLLAAGADPRSIRSDRAGRRTPLKGNAGNLIFTLPGVRGRPRRLLTAHLDTVPLCVGSRPVRRGDVVRSADPATALGADDRAGVAVLLHTACELLRRGEAHPPLTFCWFVQEEVGLHGARLVATKLLGAPQLAFNFDGSGPTKLTVGAVGGYRMQIEVLGRASHAGGAPEQGVSAIAAAALAIADLHRGGWHGLILKDGRRGTSNVGVVEGGAATNVVCDRVRLRAEARSHDGAFRQEIAAAIEEAFRRGAAEVRNVRGACAEVRIEGSLDYEAFALPDDDPSVRAAEAAVRSLGAEPERVVCNGGLDANWLTARGIPTVTLGCGQRHIHTVAEELDLAEFRFACRLAARLARGADEHPGA